jgi:hypothetical protein
MDPLLRCRFAFKPKTGLINRGAGFGINDGSINPNKNPSAMAIIAAPGIIGRMY